MMFLETNRRLMDMLELDSSTRNQSPKESEGTNRSYHVVPDFSKSIRAFTGENLGDSQTWLNGL
jgi:hypothetical protein